MYICIYMYYVESFGGHPQEGGSTVTCVIRRGIVIMYRIFLYDKLIRVSCAGGFIKRRV